MAFVAIVSIVSMGLAFLAWLAGFAGALFKLPELERSAWKVCFRLLAVNGISTALMVTSLLGWTPLS